MKCPICGEEIAKGKAKCLRCGYEVRDLSVTVQPEKEEPVQTHDIDPSRVHLSGGSSSSRGGSIFGDFFGGGLFGGILDGIFGDIFGSVGYDEYGDDDGPADYDDFGNPISANIYDRDFVEVKDVEYIDDEPEEKKKDEKKHRDASGSGHKGEKRSSDSRHKRHGGHIRRDGAGK